MHHSLRNCNDTHDTHDAHDISALRATIINVISIYKKKKQKKSNMGETVVHMHNEQTKIKYTRLQRTNAQRTTHNAQLPYRCHMLSKWKENSSPPQNNAATGARRGSQQRSETNRHARTQHHTPATTCSSPHPLCSYSTGLAARPVVTCIIYKGFVYHNYLDGVIEMEIKSLGPLRGREEQRSRAGGARAAAIYTRGRFVCAWARVCCLGGRAMVEMRGSRHRTAAGQRRGPDSSAGGRRAQRQNTPPRRLGLALGPYCVALVPDALCPKNLCPLPCCPSALLHLSH